MSYDILYNITQYSDASFLKTLYYTNVETREIVLRRTKYLRVQGLERILAELLRIMGNDKQQLKEFLDALYKTKAVISGSFILQCLINEPHKKCWEGTSDIDIYIPFNTSEEWLFDAEHPLFKFFRKDGIVTMTEYITYPEMLDMLSKRIYEIVMNGEKFQLIGINMVDKLQVDATKWIQQTFDYDFLKNVFSVSENGPTLSIYDLYGVMTKSGKFNLSLAGGYLYTGILRYQKYSGRGFTFINNTSKEMRRVIDRLITDRNHYYYNGIDRIEFIKTGRSRIALNVIGYNYLGSNIGSNRQNYLRKKYPNSM